MLEPLIWELFMAFNAPRQSRPILPSELPPARLPPRVLPPLKGWYTGVGSREIPRPHYNRLRQLAHALARQGWGVRSGSAEGADTAFEEGSFGFHRRFYLPWWGFNDHGPGTGDCVVPEKSFGEVWMDAMAIAQAHHPHWPSRPDKRGARALLTRDVFQVLGDDLATPSAFVWCWAPQPVLDGQGRVVNVAGGTGMAVRVAASHGIPVYHLDIPEHQAALDQFLASVA